MNRWMDSAVNKNRGGLFALALFLPLLLTLLYQANARSLVTRLIEVDGQIYASVVNQATSETSGQADILARYDPASQGWTNTGELSETAAESEPEQLSLPLTRCVEGNGDICYRIEGDERVLESDDGGESWRTSWKAPAGRRLFMSRAAVLESGPVDIGPYDLLVTGSGDDHRVFVAAGTEGVLIRSADGEWQRQAVLSARPTPYRATTFLEILTTIPAELGGWLLFVFIYGVGQYLYFMRRLRLILTPLTWAALILVTGGLLLLYALVTGEGLLDWGLLLLVALLYTVPVYLAYRKWVSESHNHLDDPEKGQQAGRIWLGSTVGLLFGGLLLLALWPLGLIPFYWLMALLLLAAAVSTAWWGSQRIQGLMREAGW